MKNREIKFRGISLLTGEMVYGQLLKNLWTNRSDGSGIVEILTTDNIPDFDCWEDLEDGLIRVNPETVGQFTGLKDRNGKEIYLDDLYRDEEGDIFIVMQMDCGKYALKMYSNNYIDEFVDWDKIEIIGNLFETPDLLK